MYVMTILDIPLSEQGDPGLPISSRIEAFEFSATVCAVSSVAFFVFANLACGLSLGAVPTAIIAISAGIQLLRDAPIQFSAGNWANLNLAIIVLSIAQSNILGGLALSCATTLALEAGTSQIRAEQLRLGNA